jgi:hypothetical protein
MNSLNTLPPRLVTVVLALATFWCSALIFWVQPLVGKQLLPLLGGAPAVWNICLLFFQSALLLGYALAHGLARLQRVYLQVSLYIGVWILGLSLFPVVFGSTPAADHPAAWLFLQLTTELAVPMIGLAAAAPLVQHWFARSRALESSDPYSLYAASNAGSLLALLAYPFVIEPAWSIRTQNTMWAAAYIIGLLLIIAAVLTARPTSVPATVEHEVPRPSARTYAKWLVLAAVPSSLLMGLTSYLTADLAPIPLLWVIPLALYLGSFVIAFGWLRHGPPTVLMRAVVLLAAAWAVIYRLQPSHPIWLLALIHVLFFSAVAVALHSRLAAAAPAAQHLTRFYLTLAAGGALGGVVNVLLAPVLLDSFAEYPIAALVGVFLAAHTTNERLDPMRDVLPALAIGTTALVFVLWEDLELSETWAAVLSVGVPVLAAYLLSRRSTRFVLALGAVLLTVVVERARFNRVVHAERNFYGLVRVTTSRSGRFLELRHGSTLHGAADREQSGGSEPLTYYSLAGPVADVFNDLQSRPHVRSFGIVGLGVGTLAYYANRGESWDFFEINPAVERVARDGTLFGFLERTKAQSVRIIPGDARLALQNVPDASYDLLVLDAFTSDAIPLHLLTREAVALYLSKVKQGGLIAFHTSNRYLNFAPVLADVGHALGLITIARDDWIKRVDERARRIEGSSWVVLARSRADLGALASNPRWYTVERAGKRVWTDDFSNLWTAR